MYNLCIISERDYQTHFAMQIVYEWEDIISRVLNISIVCEPSIQNIFNKIMRRTPFHSIPVSYRCKCIRFELVAATHGDTFNNEHIIPWIIDYYLSDTQIGQFVKAHSHNKLILVSSKEVDERLTQWNIPIRHVHLPLSLPDSYITNKTIKKEFDVVVMGRQNPVFAQWLKRYASAHDSFKFIIREERDGKLVYVDNRGETIDFPDDRTTYLEMLRKAKVSFYSTPGMDGGEKRTNGLNQVTPRFLEMIACGCHVLSRYKKNADTEYYEMERMSILVDNGYEDFENKLDYALTHDVDRERYSAYLDKHKTTVVAKQLMDILSLE